MILLIFVLKKNESFYFYVNYKRLNAIIIPNQYLILLILEILNKLRKIKLFIKLDLRKAYNLIRIIKGHK